MIDDELYNELNQFAAGVRILVLSDSCHSGTVARAALAAQPQPRSKLMPPAVAGRVYERHRDFYDQLQRQVAATAGDAAVEPDVALARVVTSRRLTAIAKRFRPALILVSGCQDNQTSMDGDKNGAFTEQLLRVWKDGAFTGNYGRFHELIRAGLPPTQSPNLFTLGRTGRFLAQTPFTVRA